MELDLKVPRLSGVPTTGGDSLSTVTAEAAIVPAAAGWIRTTDLPTLALGLLYR